MTPRNNMKTLFAATLLLSALPTEARAEPVTSMAAETSAKPDASTTLRGLGELYKPNVHLLKTWPCASLAFSPLKMWKAPSHFGHQSMFRASVKPKGDAPGVTGFWRHAHRKLERPHRAKVFNPSVFFPQAWPCVSNPLKPVALWKFPPHFGHMSALKTRAELKGDAPKVDEGEPKPSTAALRRPSPRPNGLQGHLQDTLDGQNWLGRNWFWALGVLWLVGLFRTDS